MFSIKINKTRDLNEIFEDLSNIDNYVEATQNLLKTEIEEIKETIRRELEYLENERKIKDEYFKKFLEDRFAECEKIKNSLNESKDLLFKEHEKNIRDLDTKVNAEIRTRNFKKLCNRKKDSGVSCSITCIKGYF